MPTESKSSETDGSVSDQSDLSSTLTDRWSRLRLGHEMLMMEDAREVLAANRRQNQAFNQMNGLSAVEEPDMGTLNLGDTHTTIYQQPQPAATQAAPQSSPLGGLLKTAAITAGLASGVGIPAALALPTIVDLFKQQPPAQQQPESIDRYWDLFVGGPKQGE